MLRAKETVFVPSLLLDCAPPSASTAMEVFQQSLFYVLDSAYYPMNSRNSVRQDNYNSFYFASFGL